VDYEPLSVALKFGFIALLYLFLLWIVRGARADLRRLSGPAPDSTGAHAHAGAHPGGGYGGRAAAASEPDPDAWLLVSKGGGLEVGARYDLFGGLSIGRSGEADIRLEDRYASGIHARVYPAAGRFYLEDMRSTNGTLLNDSPVTGEVELADGDRIAIGDTELRFEGG